MTRSAEFYCISNRELKQDPDQCRGPRGPGRISNRELKLAYLAGDARDGSFGAGISNRELKQTFPNVVAKVWEDAASRIEN